MKALRRRPLARPRVVEVSDPGALAVVYEDDVAMAWWRRAPSDDAAAVLANAAPFSWVREVDAAGGALAPLEGQLGSSRLVRELAELVDWHASLFEVDTLGVRVALAEQPMCPGFHVDKVHCRLVWVLAGAGTEWVEGPLPVDAERLVHQLPTGAAAWFKGSAWPAGTAIVHRSPPGAGRRLVATIDLL